jgi:hypothetical protein
MLKALKVILIIFAAVIFLSGLQLIFMPDLSMDMWGIEEIADNAKWFLGLLGVMWVAAGAWIIVAAVRDLLKNIMWVQFAMTKCILGVAVGAYAIIAGYVTFSQAGVILIFDAVFFVLFMALYPWGRTEEY